MQVNIFSLNWQYNTIASMIVEKVVAGTLQTNAYLVGCPSSHKAIVIDPGYGSSERLLVLIKKHQLTVEAIYLTHSHYDHIADVKKLKDEFGWPVYVHEEDSENLRNPGSDGIPNLWNLLPVEPDGYLKNGDELTVGRFKFRVIHTPGHSPGGVLFYFWEEKILFSGDTLFKGTYGRTDLPTSNPEKMKASLDIINKLPEDVIEYPGHGGLTTMEREKKWL